MACDGCSRRDLLKGIGVAAAGALLVNACGTQGGGSSLPSATTTMCGASLCIDVSHADNAALASIDGALLIDSANDTIIVIRSSETTVVAISGICTHAGCSMDFVPATHLIDCPCHGSQFAEDGHVVRGPARKALRVYAATIANNIITITV